MLSFGVRAINTFPNKIGETNGLLVPLQSFFFERYGASGSSVVIYTFILIGSAAVTPYTASWMLLDSDVQFRTIAPPQKFSHCLFFEDMISGHEE